MTQEQKELFEAEEDKLRDECGVVGIFQTLPKSDEKKSDDSENP